MNKVLVKYDNFREYCDIGTYDTESYFLEVCFSNIDEYTKYFIGISKYGELIDDFHIYFTKKIKDDDVYVIWNVYLVFDFPDEETALYFKMKFCS